MGAGSHCRWKYTRDTCAATCPSLPQQYLPSRASVLSQRGQGKECLSSAALFFIVSRTEVRSTPGRGLSTFIVFFVRLKLTRRQGFTWIIRLLLLSAKGPTRQTLPGLLKYHPPPPLHQRSTPLSTFPHAWWRCGKFAAVVCANLERLIHNQAPVIRKKKSQANNSAPTSAPPSGICHLDRGVGWPREATAVLYVKNTSHRAAKLISSTYFECIASLF